MRKIPNINKHIFKQPDVPWQIAAAVTNELSNFNINTDNPDRIVFDSSEALNTGDLTVGDFSVSLGTLTGVVENDGGTSGHYLTVAANYEGGDTVTVSYTGTVVVTFTDTAVTNNLFDYATISPRHLYELGNWNAAAGDDGEWADTGSEGDTILGAVGATPGTGGDGEATFNGSVGMRIASIGAYPDSGWTGWMKFEIDDLSSPNHCLWMWGGADRVIRVVNTTGVLRVNSTTGGDSTTGLTTATEYNMIVTHDNAGTITMRVEKNDGTAIIDDETVTYDNAEPGAALCRIGQNNSGAQRMRGSIWEFGFVDGTLTAGEKTNLMTHLKGL